MGKYEICFYGCFNVKIHFFNQIRSVSDSIQHALEDCIDKNSEFSRNYDKTDYGQVHLSVINKICLFCAALNFFHGYDLLLQDLYRKYIQLPITSGYLEQFVRAECVRQRNEVAIKLGIMEYNPNEPLSLLSPSCLLKLQERVIVGFSNFAWAPK